MRKFILLPLLAFLFAACEQSPTASGLDVSSPVMQNGADDTTPEVEDEAPEVEDETPEVEDEAPEVEDESETPESETEGPESVG